MADSTCTLTVTDYTGQREGESPKVVEVPAVNMELTMFEVKELICGQKNDPAVCAANTVLYMGKNVLDDKKKLKMYNRSRRTQMGLELHNLVQINLTVQTLQHCGSGRCVIVPLWAFCCRQKILMKVPDYETVGYLRQEVAKELGDPRGHPAAQLQLHACRQLLDDDLQTLHEAGLVDGSKVTVFVKLCFFRKKPAERGQPTDGDTSSKSPAASSGKAGDSVDLRAADHANSSHAEVEGASSGTGEGEAEAAAGAAGSPQE